MNETAVEQFRGGIEQVFEAPAPPRGPSVAIGELSQDHMRSFGHLAFYSLGADVRDNRLPVFGELMGLRFPTRASVDGSALLFCRPGDEMISSAFRAGVAGDVTMAGQVVEFELADELQEEAALAANSPLRVVSFDRFTTLPDGIKAGIDRLGAHYVQQNEVDAAEEARLDEIDRANLQRYIDREGVL